jgi:hypothetical protein
MAGCTTRCAQCDEPGDERTLFSWLFEGIVRYICYDAATCVARQLEAQVRAEAREREVDDEPRPPAPRPGEQGAVGR